MDPQTTQEQPLASSPSKDSKRRPEVEFANNHDMARMLQNEDTRVLEVLMTYYAGRLEALLLSAFPHLQGYQEDVISEALIKLWEKRELYNPSKGTVTTWFFAIAFNKARSMCKRGWVRERNAEFQMEELETTMAFIVEMDQVSSARDTAREQAINDFLDTLDDDDYAILTRYADGQERGQWARELAQDLNMKPGNIRCKGPRLLERLRRFLERRGVLGEENS